MSRAKYDPSAPPLNPAKIRQIGFRLSRFDFNNLANPSYRAGPFRLEVCICSYIALFIVPRDAFDTYAFQTSIPAFVDPIALFGYTPLGAASDLKALPYLVLRTNSAMPYPRLSFPELNIILGIKTPLPVFQFLPVHWRHQGSFQGPFPIAI